MSAETTHSADAVSSNGPPRVPYFLQRDAELGADLARGVGPGLAGDPGEERELAVGRRHEHDIRAIIAKNEDIASETH